MSQGEPRGRGESGGARRTARCGEESATEHSRGFLEAWKGGGARERARDGASSRGEWVRGAAEAVVSALALSQRLGGFVTAVAALRLHHSLLLICAPSSSLCSPAARAPFPTADALLRTASNGRCRKPTPLAAPAAAPG